MKIQSYTAIVGTDLCNAKCPFCVSKMTPKQGINHKLKQVNWRNFRIGATFAHNNNVSTFLMTGKGEPTLYPELVTDYLNNLRENEFPFREIQTNGILIAQNKDKYEPYLDRWYDKGLTTFAISIVHYNTKRNQEIYTQEREYVNLVELVDFLHEKKFSIRLTNIMLDGYIDKPSELENMIDFAKTNKVEQLSVCPVRNPLVGEDKEVYDWTKAHALSDEKINAIKDFCENKGKRIMKLMHGAVVYDINGQNVCLKDCLTLDPESEDLRQLIFFPDGHLKYDWQYTGATLI